MNFKLEELGTLRETAERDRKLLAEASWQTLRGFGDGIKTAVRADLKQAGIKGAAKLAGAWRGKMFPANAGKHANKPAYALGSSAAKIVETFEEGPLISAHGGALLVPIGKARRVKLKPGQRRADLIQEVMRLYGVTKLVSQRLKKTGEIALGVFTALESGRRKFVPLFILRKSVQAPRLLHGAAIIARKSAEAARVLPAESFALFERRREQAPGGQGQAYRTTASAGR